MQLNYCVQKKAKAPLHVTTLEITNLVFFSAYIIHRLYSDVFRIKQLLAHGSLVLLLANC